MKNSIRTKLTFIISGLIVLFVILILASNGLFLKKFYYNNKEKSLLDVFSIVNNIDPKSLDNNTLDLEKIENRRNLRIIILDNELKTLYESSPGERNFRGRMNRSNAEIMDNERRGKNPLVSPNGNSIPSLTPPQPLRGRESFDALIKEKLPEMKNKNPLIEHRLDERLGTNFINLFAMTKDGNYLLVSTSTPALDESAALASKFLILTGLGVILLGAAFAYHISNRITQPILELNQIAQRMTHLDFSKKYSGKSDDEIGALGISINTLSDELEKSILELKEANAKLQSDILHERKIDEMRKEFISNVSHELKTPIALIQGYAEGLRLNINEDEENKNYYCDVIMDEAKKMNKLVVTLLDLAEIESGQVHLEWSSFKISDLLEDVLRKTSILMKDKNVSVERDIQENLTVWADYHKVEQVIFNYINNALNHVSSKGTIKVSTKLSIRETGGQKVRISVFNEGAGIPEESLGKIWGSFYKVDKARTRDYGGTGLGLSVVKAIVSAHQNLYGAANLENGVEFWFELDISDNGNGSMQHLI